MTEITHPRITREAVCWYGGVSRHPFDPQKPHQQRLMSRTGSCVAQFGWLKGWSKWL